LKITQIKDFDADGTHTFLGIFARNCLEWIVTDLALQLNSITSVTFYSTLGDVAFEHVCKLTQVETICVSPESIPSLIKYKNQFGLNLKTVILYDYTQFVKEGTVEELTKAGFDVHLFSNLIKYDKKTDGDVQLKISQPDTVVTLCFTSGTTALPKGAILTQRNFVSQLINIKCAGVELDNTDIHFSYLPLAHVMERIALSASLLSKVKIGIISGEVRKALVTDLEILKPTYLVAVPRVLNTFRGLVFSNFEKVDPGCKKNLIEKALRVKREGLQNGQLTHGFYDRFVFNKVKNKFGGRIKFIITGSAPLPKELADDIKILFSCPIIEAYGMTECCGAATVSNINDYSNQSTGGAIDTMKIKLVDVPEMNYHSKTTLDGNPSPTGEICFKGPSVFKGYFRNPEETAKMIDKDGWLHSGDVGRILPGDRGLRIFDRVKEIFKLSQGEYIAPSKLESVYGKSKYVLQICVYGNSQKSYLIGIIVPNKPNVAEFLKRIGKIENDKTEIDDLLNSKEVVDEIKQNLDKLAKENNLNSLEKLQKFVIANREFTIDNGCLTPTMKIVRRKIEQEFQEEINKIYTDN
jgi:long-chain acyl-CoA synthetase